MMNRKSLIGALVGLLLLTGIIGANLVMAGGRQDTKGSVQSEEANSTDDDNLECPAQGLPACAGQMNDEKSEGSENEADEANENDSHEDAEGADHQCPPDCDTENGEEG